MAEEGASTEGTHSAIQVPFPNAQLEGRGGPFACLPQKSPRKSLQELQGLRLGDAKPFPAGKKLEESPPGYSAFHGTEALPDTPPPWRLSPDLAGREPYHLPSANQEERT